MTSLFTTLLNSPSDDSADRVEANDRTEGITINDFVTEVFAGNTER